MDFEISYTDKEITPWGGMVFLRQMLEKIGFRQAIELQEDLPRPGSNRGYNPTTIIEGFITSIWCGANRFLHTEVTGNDMALSKIFGWKECRSKIPINGFSPNLHRPSINGEAIIFIHGYLIMLNLTIFLLILILR